jgi:dephospho-CoA kinase
MISIAISGGIACGKSVVASQLSRRGIPVCEADEVGHQVLRRGGVVYDAVVEAFGSGIVSSASGEIDRTVLAGIVFSDPDRLKRLNSATHPEILRRMHRWVAEQSGGIAAAGVVPLLYEAGDEGQWDVVICVAAPEAEQLRRLESRGLTGSEARARIASQMPLREKMERADYVLYNGGSIGLLEEQTDRVMRRICGD